ncbi:hypothetical protein [Mycobacterium avium]|nr:hypothetical protein [Mycobacterium avium]
MPKRRTQPLGAQATDGDRLVGTYQAAALSVAVIVSAIFYGLGALLAAAVVIPVIYGLARLRAHTPDARNTAEMIGATLGPRAATAAGIIQLCAYLALAAAFSGGLGLQLLHLVSPNAAPAAVLAWLPAGAVAAAAVGGTTVCLASTRILASLVAILATTGLLIYLYLAVAVTTRIASGSEPVVIGTAATPTHLSAQVVAYGVAFVGVEIITANIGQMAAPVRSMSLAITVVVAAAVTLWVADHTSVTGPWRWTAKHFGEAVPEFYAEAGQIWMAVAAATLGMAGVLAAGWGAVRIATGLAITRGKNPCLRWRATVVAAIALIAAAITAHVPRGHGIAAVTLSTAVLLLMTLYVLVSEANSRLPGDSVVAWWVRLAIPTLGLVAVLKPIADSHFAPLDVATVIAAAVVVSAAAITAALLVPAAPTQPAVDHPGSSDDNQADPTRRSPAN